MQAIAASPGDSTRRALPRGIRPGHETTPAGGDSLAAPRRHYPHPMHSFSTLIRFIWRSGKRIAVFAVGVALLAVGLVMFVTPGPGIVLVVAGLAVLATEFAWAEHLLDKAKRQAARAGQSAQRVPGVAAVTERAGRLVPQRWRRTVATSVVVSEQTVDGLDITHSTVAAVSITELDGGQAVPADRPRGGRRAPAEVRRTDAEPGGPAGGAAPGTEPGPGAGSGPGGVD